MLPVTGNSVMMNHVRMNEGCCVNAVHWSFMYFDGMDVCQSLQFYSNTDEDDDDENDPSDIVLQQKYDVLV